jgi:putative NADH-flavin reductase
MEKVIVFGASGGTGIEVVKQALEAGYRVTALVRSPERFTLAHTNLVVKQGDVMLAHTIDDAIAGQDVVISAIGNRSTKPTVLYSEGIRNILAAAQQNNIRRMICISAGGLDVNPKAGFFVRLLTKYVLQRILKAPYADLRLMETSVRQSDTIYTIIRPSRLLDKPMTGKYRVGINADIESPFSIARADVAHFIVHHIDDAATFHSITAISY